MDEVTQAVNELNKVQTGKSTSNASRYKIESGAFDDDFRRRVPDFDPFCMPPISTGDYDTTEYETQFV